MLINYVFPKSKIKEIIYTDTNGVLKNDINIESLKLSYRTSNALLDAGYKTINEVVFEKFSKLKKIKNMGPRSVKELVDFVSNNCEIIFEIDLDVFEMSLLTKTLNLLEYDSYDISFLLYTIKKNVKIYCNEYDSVENVSDENLLNDILFQDNIKNILSKYILTLISENNYSVLDIEALFPKNILNRGLVTNVINNLIESERIELFNGFLRIKLPTINDWLLELKDKYKAAVEYRLKGYTLEKTGKKMGYTRERIRQIVDKSLKQKPVLIEDDFAYWFSKYKFDSEAFEYIFNERIETYMYLNMVYEPGLLDIESMIDDNQMNQSIFSRYKEYINKDNVFIDDEYVPCRKYQVIKKIIQKRFSNEPIQFDEFYEYYSNFLRTNVPNFYEKLSFTNSHAIKSYIDRYNYILISLGNKFRYYPMSEIDIIDFVSSLNLEQFVDVEISTLKIFINSSEIMKDYFILDEYELHNLLKRTVDIWNQDNKYEVEFLRMPNMIFGKANKKKQVLDLFHELYPISFEEFYIHYYKNYGVLESTCRANLIPYIDEYYDENSYNLKIECSEDTIENFRTILTDDFYFIEDLIDLYSKNFKIDKDKLPDIDKIKQICPILGYTVHIICIIKNTYHEASDYFTKFYLSFNELDLNILDKRLKYIGWSNFSLNKLKLSYEIIEVNDRKYLKYVYFNKLYNIDKEDIADYIYSVIDFSRNYEFFTIYKLVQDGFSNCLGSINLETADFGEWFYTSLLKNSKKIKYIKIGSEIVFYNSHHLCTIIDFLKFIILTYKENNVDTIIDFIRKDFSVIFNKNEIVQYINNSDLYYDLKIDKVFTSKENYYDDI